MVKIINSWGNTSYKKVKVSRSLDMSKSYLNFGNNNSYGDASIPLGNNTLEISHRKAEEGFYYSSSTIEEAVSFLKKSMYSIPGKSNVTLGGAVAADVHGKDGQLSGSFIKNIESINLLLPSGEAIVCNRAENAEIFYATVGGYGLTGVILGVKLIKDLPALYSQYESKNLKGTGLNNLFQNFPDSEDSLSVAWLDLLDEEYKWVITHSTPTCIEVKEERKFFALKKELNFSVPIVSNNYLNLLSYINKIYFLSKKENSVSIKKRESIHYPLNFLSDTRNIARNRKVIQIQFSIPIRNESSVDSLLKLLIQNQKPLLCSVKKLSNNETDINFSFVQKGWTIAVDFSEDNFNREEIRTFYKKLIELEGKVYLAKDSTLNQNEFKNMFRNLEEWSRIVKKIDPNNIFQSEMSYRLGIKTW